jgi:hypothetical protein
MSPKRLLANGLKLRRLGTLRAHSTEHVQSFQLKPRRPQEISC